MVLVLVLVLVLDSKHSLEYEYRRWLSTSTKKTGISNTKTSVQRWRLVSNVKTWNLSFGLRSLFQGHLLHSLEVQLACSEDWDRIDKNKAIFAWKVKIRQTGFGHLF
jgi:hypothetical protein